MKPNKDLRGKASFPNDGLKKGVKLAPIKKSGKDRHSLYSTLDEVDEEMELSAYKKRESVLDYFDDGEEEDRDEEDEDNTRYD